MRRLSPICRERSHLDCLVDCSVAAPQDHEARGSREAPAQVFMENNHREQNSEHPLEVEQSDPVNAEIRARPKSINTGPRTPPKPTTPPSVSASEPRTFASADCCPLTRNDTRKTLISNAAPR